MESNFKKSEINVGRLTPTDNDMTLNKSRSSSSSYEENEHNTSQQMSSKKSKSSPSRSIAPVMPVLIPDNDERVH